MTPLVVLGATGSVGRQALEVARWLEMPVVGLAARRASLDLARLAEEFPEADVVSVEPPSNPGLPGLDGRLRWGEEEVIGLAGRSGCTVLNGIVGAAGLRPTLAALTAGNRVALANKESLVTGGPLVMDVAEKSGAELIPVDSEHSALFQCLVGEHPGDLARLVLTASGGPFRGMSRADLVGVTPSQALAHPTWEMGGRITIDSATLMNKGLEVIEAHHLFGIDFDRIQVVVHPGSIVHSLVEFVDGSIKAQLGQPDMRVPIQYAFTYPRRMPGANPSLELTDLNLEFGDADRVTFPALDLAYDVGRMGGTAPAAMNAADEVAVESFLEGRLPFLAIVDVVGATVEAVDRLPGDSVEEILWVDAEARRVAASLASATASP